MTRIPTPPASYTRGTSSGDGGGGCVILIILIWIVGLTAILDFVFGALALLVVLAVVVKLGEAVGDAVDHIRRHKREALVITLTVIALLAAVVVVSRALARLVVPDVPETGAQLESFLRANLLPPPGTGVLTQTITCPNGAPLQPGDAVP